MLIRGLTDLLEVLAEKRELQRVTVEVNLCEEIAEITDRAMRASGPALLFEKVGGCRFPLVTNLLGTDRRMALSLGNQSPEEVAVRLLPLLLRGHHDSAPSKPPAGFAPKKAKAAPCQQVVRLGGDVDLAQLPIPKSFANDTHPVITAACLHSRNLQTRTQHVEHFPLLVLARNRLGIPCEHTSYLARNMMMAREQGEHLPVALTVGSQSEYVLAALLHWPTELDSAIIAAAIKGQAIEATQCRTHDLEIPADAELVLEGHIDPRAMPVTSPPFVYDLSSRIAPVNLRVIEISAITHRTRPVMVGAILGQPPHELCVWRRTVERLLLPVVQTLAPEVVDLSCPDFAGRRHIAFVSIRKQYAGQSEKVASLLWGLAPWMHTKLLVLVDETVDVHRTDDVWLQAATNAHFRRDLIFHDGPADCFDRSVDDGSLASQIAIDATTKSHAADCGPRRMAQRSDSVRQQVAARWREFGFPTDLQPRQP